MSGLADTTLTCPAGQFQLKRYPARKRETLRAWCGADLLLIEAAQEISDPNAGILVVNDDHGTLCIALQPSALWTDSALSAQAMQHNAAANERPATPIVWSTECPQGQFVQVLLRIPKQSSYLEYQLALLHRVMPVGATLICGGMDKHLSPNTAELIEAYFGPVKRHRGARKARLFSATREDRPSRSVPADAQYYCDYLDAEISARANVFSRESLDIGSRFLMEYLSTLPKCDHVADLACGNGVLGLYAAKIGLRRELGFFDESAMAIASAKDNAGKVLHKDAVLHFHQGDGLTDTNCLFDLIVCNPPFHLGHTVDAFAGERLISQCAAQLLPLGRLILVANRHLEYGKVLKRHFRVVEKAAQNQKFIIWSASSVDSPT